MSNIDEEDIILHLPDVKEKSLEELFLFHLLKEHGYTYADIAKILARGDEKKLVIPCSIFKNKLGALEAICKYLKEEIALSNKEIANLLKRDARTIWTSFHKALKKMQDRFVLEREELFVPVEIFANRKYTAMEALIKYLKEEQKMKYVDIAKLIGKDPRNIWNMYNNLKKRENEKST